MASQYEPSDHIQQLAVAPRDESVLDQREVTVQSYQSTVPFNLEKLEAGLKNAWLSPKTRFGLFSRLRIASDSSATVVLGLQDELAVRTYDYDTRRPLWFSWRNVIVDTVSIHYFCDEQGLLQFTATGGGRRITDALIHEFNATFLSIPKEAVSRRHFDLAKLRTLCFTRFLNSLYMVRFTDPSGEVYRSIDHALFQSRGYIDPEVERLKEIQADLDVTIESFDSDINIQASVLAAGIQVRFFLRGVSGSLRLRFPKVRYKQEPSTPEEQAKVFYQLVDTAVSAILDADYYKHEPRRLDELDIDIGMFVDMVDLAPFREVMANSDSRVQFLSTSDFGDAWQHWQPHLRALDELAQADEVAAHCSTVVRDLAVTGPGRLPALIQACRGDAKLTRIGDVIAGTCCDMLQRVPAERRAAVESELVAWALGQPDEAWRVDVAAGVIQARGLRLRLDDLSLDTIVEVLGKLLEALHAGLMSSAGDIGTLLAQMHWCVEAVSVLPPYHFRLPAALRLVAAGQVPRSLRDSGRVLQQPAGSFADLDDGLLEQFGLPAWPFLRAAVTDDQIIVLNDGIGAALGVLIRPAGILFGGEDVSVGDLAPGEQVALALPAQHKAVDIRFQKFDAERQLTVAVEELGSASVAPLNAAAPIVSINRKRLEEQRTYRKQIDPNGVVIGASPSLLKIFEEIHYANKLGESASVLILGEPGVGKTHIARLIHESGDRSSGPFRAVNAGGAGGDLNIQRGEWIGYSRGHGIANVDAKGKPGHLAQADGGTLFIDEFATMSLELQVILLSVLEEREVERVGGESIKPSVRCIFATNSNIDAAMSAGTLRRDLVDRIAITIQIPPLRERRGDVLMLARHIAPTITIDEQCLIALLRHDWPGNIRELKMTLGRAVARAENEEATLLSLEHCDLPQSIADQVRGMRINECRRELWVLADSLARSEGYEPGEGLQRRTAVIMGVNESQASKMYKAFELNKVAAC